MEERRKFVRISEDLPMSYEILEKRKTGRSLTKDISQGGIRFFVEEFIPKYSLLRVHFPDQKKLFDFEPIAEVMWVKKESHGKKYEIGAEFVDISEKATKQLINYIKSLLKKGQSKT